MNIKDIYGQGKKIFSFELFPPKSEEASQHLFTTIKDLIPLELACVSVTYGAGGSTRELTHDLLMRIQQKTDLENIVQVIQLKNIMVLLLYFKVT